MVINRSWETIERYTYGTETDKYGQLRKGEPTITQIPVVWKIFSQTRVTNPKYNDVEIECLTVEPVNVGDYLVKDGVKYNVLFIIPGKYNQVFLKKC